ncbi:BRCA1-associated RING domain protein 1-like [Lolium rigidum]|uniref:BRCA1-associated RING domain protein 1-like n=1 Tax=Lolium rigidum TaxID=89674 RepID=UPI001F5C11BB|nr:BRCA1-associated RING domain protein 1-like [Lolium rigidum]
MSATHTSTVVNIETETDDGSLEVLQQSYRQNEPMASQSSSPAKSSLAGNKNVSPTKGPHKRVCADATKVASLGVNASKTGQHLHPCKKNKGSGKHSKLEDYQGDAELRRLQTPTNLFEDECVFCHSFRTSENFHGPIVLYRKGRIVSSDEGVPKNAIYVHKECMDWAPRVCLVGDDIVNMEKEISRSSRLKCSRCKLPGAALGCYHHPCPKNYHVPCAVMIPECRWDMKNRHVWCPKHASDPLPCDVTSSPIMESGITSPILQNQYSDKQGMSVIHIRENQQVDQLNTSSFSSLPQGQCSGKGLRLLTKGYSQCSGYRREEKQMNQSRTLVNEKVLLGSALSASQKDSLKKFASLTNSTLVEEWDKNVTHVIVDRSAGIICGRSYEVLMAILSGKWVVRAECYGPKKGRAGAAEGAPKLFSGLHFFLSAYMDLELRENLENLISAAEGKVLEAQESACENPAKVYFVYGGGPPRDFAATLLVHKEIEEARNYAAWGAQVICHLWLFDAITSYDVRMLERSYREGR